MNPTQTPRLFVPRTLATWTLAALTALLVAGTLAPARARKHAKPPPCPSARYRIAGEPILAGGRGALLEMGSVAELVGVCEPVPPTRWKPTREGTTKVSSRWKACPGVAGRVRLDGTLVDGCRRLTGTVQLGKRRRRIDATLSRCGDGFVDVGNGEACDGGAACAVTCVPENGSLALVGEVASGRALIALVRDANGLTAYTCGVGEHVTTHTGWFFGAPANAADPGALPPLTSADGLVLAGRVTGGIARGP